MHGNAFPKIFNQETLSDSVLNYVSKAAWPPGNVFLFFMIYRIRLPLFFCLPLKYPILITERGSSILNQDPWCCLLSLGCIHFHFFAVIWTSILEMRLQDQVEIAEHLEYLATLSSLKYSYLETRPKLTREYANLLRCFCLAENSGPNTKRGWWV